MEEEMIGGLGMPELIIIGIIVLIIFGAGKLPEIGSGVGKAIRGFKDAVKTPPPEEIAPPKQESKKIEEKSE